MRIWPGRPYPLGATWDGAGVNFTLFAEHATKVELCLFENPEDAPPLPEGRSMPEGFDFIGGINRIEPGMSVTLLFLNPLPAARYAMFCNDEDAQSGEPHSKSGEYAEFTIT